jgi:transcription elongation factor Elf1
MDDAADVERKVNRKAQDDSLGEDAKVYSFPTRSRCPECHDLRTRASSTQGQVQYRVCGICGHRYTAGGTRV